MDKEKININEAFIDQSWQEMATLLDQEMPVRSKKRRWIWIWFFGLGLLLTGWLANQRPSKTPPVNALPIPQKSIAKVKAPNLKKLPEQSSAATTKATIKPFKNKQSSDKFSTNRTNNNLKFASTSEVIAQAVTSDAGTTSNEIENRTSAIAHTNKEAKISVTEDLRLTDNLSLNLYATPNLEDQTIPFLAFVPNPINVAVSHYPKSNKPWHWGVYTGTNFPKLGGWQFGIFANKQLSRKWSAYVGLGYGQRRVFQKSKEDLAVADAALEEMSPIETSGEMDFPGTGPNDPTGTGSSPNPDNTTNDMTGQNSNSTQIAYRDFHYFELPIIIQYRLNQRFSMEIGGQINHLHGYHFSRGSEQVFSTQHGQFLAPTATRFVDQNLAKNISNWNYGLIGGLSYRITPRWETFANYHYGLNNYLQTSDEETKKWRQGQVGIRLYIR